VCELVLCRMRRTATAESPLQSRCCRLTPQYVSPHGYAHNSAVLWIGGVLVPLPTSTLTMFAFSRMNLPSCKRNSHSSNKDTTLRAHVHNCNALAEMLLLLRDVASCAD
jgi:hypothetical protein